MNCLLLQLGLCLRVVPHFFSPPMSSFPSPPSHSPGCPFYCGERQASRGLPASRRIPLDASLSTPASRRKPQTSRCLHFHARFLLHPSFRVPPDASVSPLPASHSPRPSLSLSSLTPLSHRCLSTFWPPRHLLMPPTRRLSLVPCLSPSLSPPPIFAA
jgi:hypothetical protein